MSKYDIEADWSDTPVLTEHKAFLFDKSKQLSTLPVSINFIELKDSEYYTKGYWQGAYIFNITLSGFVLRDNITHQEDNINGWYNSQWVKRGLHIEDILYTASDKIEMNSLQDLTLLKEIELPKISLFFFFRLLLYEHYPFFLELEQSVGNASVR